MRNLGYNSYLKSCLYFLQILRTTKKNIRRCIIVTYRQICWQNLWCDYLLWLHDHLLLHSQAELCRRYDQQYPYFNFSNFSLLRNRSVLMVLQSSSSINYILFANDHIQEIIHKTRKSKGLIYIFFVMKLYNTYKPWYDKTTVKTVLKPDQNRL